MLLQLFLQPFPLLTKQQNWKKTGRKQEYPEKEITFHLRTALLLERRKHTNEEKCNNTFGSGLSPAD